MTVLAQMNSGAVLPPSSRQLQETIERLQQRIREASTKVDNVESTVRISTAEMYQFAVDDPVSAEIDQAAEAAGRALDNGKALMREIEAISNDAVGFLGTQSYRQHAESLISIAADASEIATRLDDLHRRTTQRLRQLLAARTPDFLASIREHLTRFSSVAGATFAIFGMVYTVVFYLAFDISVLDYVNSLTDFLLMGVAHATGVLIIVAAVAGLFVARAELLRRAARSRQTDFVKLAKLVRVLDQRRRQPIRVLPMLAVIVITALFGAAYINAGYLANGDERSTVYIRSGSTLPDSKVLGTVANYVFVLRFNDRNELSLPHDSGTPIVLRADEVRCVMRQSAPGAAAAVPDSCVGKGGTTEPQRQVLVRVDGESLTSWRRFARDKMACEPADNVDWDRRLSDTMITSTPLFSDGRWDELDAHANRKYSIVPEGCESDWSFDCMKSALRARLSGMATAGASRVESFGIAGFASATGTPEGNLMLSQLRAGAVACLLADQVPDHERHRCGELEYVSRLVLSDRGALTFTPLPGTNPIGLHLHAMGEGHRLPDYVGSHGDASDRRVLAIACGSRSGARPVTVSASNDSSAIPAPQKILDVGG